MQTMSLEAPLLMESAWLCLEYGSFPPPSGAAIRLLLSVSDGFARVPWKQRKRGPEGRFGAESEVKSGSCIPPEVPKSQDCATDPRTRCLPKALRPIVSYRGRAPRAAGLPRYSIASITIESNCFIARPNEPV